MAGSVQIRIKIGIPAASFNEATKGLISAALHAHSQELADLERPKVRGRTPVRYGALRESLNLKAYPSPKSRALIKIWYDDEPQLFEWHRVYSYYQEYLPLGKSTYTPNKAQMLFHVTDEDAPGIEEWASRVGQTALDEWTAQAQAEADAAALEALA
jgi:hypothetical protein